ncbi:MAG: hypothetical protein LBN93_10840 [Candidatus Symbiothrix sp.]|jgi:hypothetical protein|nr:hypothetical protein [Candidatus Symbiothrix sp.]
MNTFIFIIIAYATICAAIILFIPAVRNQTIQFFKESIPKTYRDISWDLHLNTFARTMKRIVITLVLIITACLMFLATPFLISIFTRYEKEKQQRKRDIEKENQKRDNSLYYSRMGGAGKITCKECGYSKDTVSFVHGSYDAVIGYQCQSCGKFHEIESHSKEYHKINIVHPLVCECGGKLSCDNPLFCPQCKSKNLAYKCNYRT